MAACTIVDRFPLWMCLVLGSGLFLGGCTAAPEVKDSAVIGAYELSAGGFNEELYLDIKPDGAYVLHHLWLNDAIGPDGVFQMTGGVDQGTWTLQTGILKLSPAMIGTDRSPMFLAGYCDQFQVSANKGKIQLTSVSTPVIPAGTPARIVLRKITRLPAWLKNPPAMESGPTTPAKSEQ
jgi:hypothetical protein